MESPLKTYHLVVEDVPFKFPYEGYAVRGVFYRQYKRAAYLLASINEKWRVVTVSSPRRIKMHEVLRGINGMMEPIDEKSDH